MLNDEWFHLLQWSKAWSRVPVEEFTTWPCRNNDMNKKASGTSQLACRHLRWGRNTSPYIVIFGTSMSWCMFHASLGWNRTQIISPCSEKRYFLQSLAILWYSSRQATLCDECRCMPPVSLLIADMSTCAVVFTLTHALCRMMLRCLQRCFTMDHVPFSCISSRGGLQYCPADMLVHIQQMERNKIQFAFHIRSKA